jgi:hypothetical protein
VPDDSKVTGYIMYNRLRFLTDANTFIFFAHFASGPAPPLATYLSVCWGALISGLNISEYEEDRQPEFANNVKNPWS